MTRYLNRTPLMIVSLLAVLLPAKFLTTPSDSNQTDPAPLANQAQTTEAVPVQNSAELALKAMREKVMTARPLALYYTTGGTFGLDSVEQHASDMTILAPQCYWLDQRGNVQGGIPASTMDAARQSGLPVMALLYNQDFNRRVATVLLHDRRLQKTVISNLVEIARKQDLLGFQLDLENIDPDDINLYTRFVHDAAKEFHHEGRMLSVAVVPRFLDSAPGQWAAAYDYSGLAHATDFLTLMAYDNSGRLGQAGPIAGYNWVRNALEYARTHVPTDKLLLGIALYGREWSDDGRSLQARTMPFPETQALLNRLSLTPRWDERHRSPWFEYRTSGTVNRVWYENARSIQEKLRLLDQYQLRGFAAWRLGMEDPRIWSMVTAMRESQPQAHDDSGVSGY
ncbi:MAG TPA: glycosyl hydrolase family 18 protein [Terriglobia bacterium]|nr:glycosyl hydrolase family 18 protein [Terriglobia bacterium]